MDLSFRVSDCFRKFAHPMLVRCYLLLGSGGFLLSASVTFAGGGPENVCLVINSRSWASRTIANHFIRLRQIPPTNVVYIDWSDDLTSTDVATLREKILGPALLTIQRRNLSAQIDYLVYSSDFPYAIDLHSDAAKVPPHQVLTPVGSLTGATFFYGPVMAANAAVIGVNNNHYFRRADDETSASHGFRAWYGWGPKGELQESGGEQYLLSTMLGYTSGRGNSVREVIRAMELSVSADGSQPKGTIYYVRNDDVRSTTRHNDFPAAMDALKTLKVGAEQLNGIIPSGKKDVQGVMVGKSDFDWKSSGNVILPGAICENFTSFGGVLREASGQTPLTEFIRHGAAGSSGTVTEPYAVKEKFPSPMLHVHYVRGCTLAESFYQAIHGPYQQLIVGDPLCRPWAKIPKISVTGVEEGANVKGIITLGANATTTSSSTVPAAKVDRLELYLDGVRIQTKAAGETFSLDTAQHPDGYHELRVVGVEASPIETQGRKIITLLFDNRGESLTLTASTKNARWGTPLKISAQTKKASSILIFQNSELLGKIMGAEGSISVEPRELGEGLVELRAYAIGTGGVVDRVASRPLDMTVEPTTALTEQRLGNVKLADGMRLRIRKDQTSVLQDTGAAEWLSKAGIEAKTPFEISGIFTATNEEIHQFQMKHSGRVRIVVDGVELYNGEEKTPGWRFLPVNLASGKHTAAISGELGSPPQLQIRFGGPGAVSLNGKQFQHLP